MKVKTSSCSIIPVVFTSKNSKKGVYYTCKLAMCAMKIKSPISEKYGAFLNALLNNAVKPHEDISYQIFYDLFRIREFQWQYKVEFGREVDASLSDIFQDIIAHYLKILTNYEILCEHKQGKLRPDILIRTKGQNKAIVEVKTTIGYNRNLLKGNAYKKRLEELSREFKIPITKTFYIFEGANNVTGDFAKIFESKKNHKVKKYIFPLFRKTAHPFNISNIGNRKKEYQKYTDKEVFELYCKSKLTDFNDILSKIK